MTQPKTQAELQARVLEVLRRAFPCCSADPEGDYLLLSTARYEDGYLGKHGCVVHPPRELRPEALDALAEASRLLRDGILNGVEP